MLIGAASSMFALAIMVGMSSNPPDEVTFEPTHFQSLRVGDSLPAELIPVAGTGLVLRSVRSVGDDSHFVFSHSLEPVREASLLLREGRLTGTITQPHDIRAVITGLRAGHSLVRFEDAMVDLPCAYADDLRVPAAEGGLAGPTCDDPAQVDVLVLFTDAAMNQAGGLTQVTDSVHWAIADSNNTYASSGITLQARLVGLAPATGYIEDPSAMANDLYRLRDPADGFIDEVHAMRDATGADLVALVRASGGGACGIAWLIGGSASDEAWAFSVTSIGCFGGKTFTHELGHSMGCCHAPGDGGGCTSGGVFPYSVGHRFFGTSGTEYRTVMAYAPGTRIGRFASPLVNFDGTPTGLVDERDNAGSIEITRFVFTNFRCLPCPTDFDGDGVTGAADLAGLLGGWGGPGFDLDSDGVAGASDLSILLGSWGNCP